MRTRKLCELIPDRSNNDSKSNEILRQIENLRLDVSPNLFTMQECDTPIAILPFHRNSKFVGRAKLLDQIDLKYGSGQPSVALCGLGGVG